MKTGCLFIQAAFSDFTHFQFFVIHIKIYTGRYTTMNAVIYARYSSDNQREESIEGQLRECTEFAERKRCVKTGLKIL